MKSELESTAVLKKQYGILQPFKSSRNFTALWVGQSLSRFGDALFGVILPYLVYSLSGSPLAMGKVMACLMLPQVLLFPFTGLLSDRVSRMPLMLGADFVRFLLLGLLTVLGFGHHLSLWFFYVFALGSGAMSGLFQPAYASVRAQVFTPDIRNAANSLTQISGQAAQLLGPTLGGLLLAVTSSTVGMGLDALTYGCSIVSLLFLKITSPPRVQQSFSLRSFGRELFGGWQEIQKHPWLWVTISAFSLVNLAFGGITAVLLPWLIKEHLHLPALDYGLVSSAGGVGALLAALVFGQRTHWRRRGIIAYTGVAMSGLTLGLMAVWSAPLLLALCYAISEIGMMIFGLIWEGSLQELIPTETYGRVASLDMLGSFALMPVGYLLTGWLANGIGGIWTLALEGAMIFLLAILLLLVPGIRRFD